MNRYLETDPAFADLLVRGLISLRRSARWLLETYGWDATEEAVVSALRRYRDEEARSSLWDARPALHETQMDIISGLALVTIPHLPEARDAALNARMGTHKARTLTVLEGRRVTRILTEEHAVEDIRKNMGRWEIEEVVSPVHCLRLVFPEPASQVALMINVLATLAHHGIEVLEAMTCAPDYLVIVRSEAATDAYHVLFELCREEQLSPGDGHTDGEASNQERGLGHPSGRPAFP